MLNTFQSFIIIISIFYSIYISNKLYLYYNKLDKKKLNKNIMGTILILFGILKLYDINTFSSIFQKYDIISKIFPIYSYIYPFLEIYLGLNFITNTNIKYTQLLTKNLMMISILSVIISLHLGEKLRCGCMGSFFHIPLSYVTISENLYMLYLTQNF